MTHRSLIIMKPRKICTNLYLAIPVCENTNVILS